MESLPDALIDLLSENVLKVGLATEHDFDTNICASLMEMDPRDLSTVVEGIVLALQRGNIRRKSAMIQHIINVHRWNGIPDRKLLTGGSAQPTVNLSALPLTAPTDGVEWEHNPTTMMWQPQSISSSAYNAMSGWPRPGAVDGSVVPRTPPVVGVEDPRRYHAHSSLGHQTPTSPSTTDSTDRWNMDELPSSLQRLRRRCEQLIALESKTGVPTEDSYDWWGRPRPAQMVHRML